MPLWTDAYLADCGHLDDAETGRYLLMLIHLWRAPRQRFPNDDAWLARKFRRSIEDVQSQIRPLITEFCSTDGNWVWQNRLAKEFKYLADKRRQQSDRAKVRWSKDKESCHARNAASGNALSTPTPTTKEEKKEKRIDKSIPKKYPRDALIPVLGDDLASAVVEHRQRIRKPLTVRAAEMLARRFEKYHDPPAGAEMMLARGWQGFEAQWMENDRRKGNTPNDRSDRKTEMARRQDDRSKADGGMADEANRGDAVPLLSTHRLG